MDRVRAGAERISIEENVPDLAGWIVFILQILSKPCALLNRAVLQRLSGPAAQSRAKSPHSKALRAKSDLTPAKL